MKNKKNVLYSLIILPVAGIIYSPAQVQQNHDARAVINKQAPGTSLARYPRNTPPLSSGFSIKGLREAIQFTTTMRQNGSMCIARYLNHAAVTNIKTN